MNVVWERPLPLLSLVILWRSPSYRVQIISIYFFFLISLNYFFVYFIENIVIRHRFWSPNF